MKVMLSCGPSTRKVIDIISKLADGIDYSYHKTVKEFIRESKTRKVSFNRIIFTSNFLSKKPESDFKDLGNFLKDNSDSSEVIFVLQSPDKAIEDKFLKIFNSPLCTIAYVSRPTPAALIDLVKEPMPTVKAKFYELDKGKSSDANVEEEYVEVALPNDNIAQDSTNASTSTGSNSSNNEYSNTTVQSDNTSNMSVDPYSSNSGMSEYSGIQNEGSALGSEDSYDDEDDDLSVGSFGTSHEDTGVFDENEDDEELQEHLNRMNNMTESEETSVEDNKDERIVEDMQEGNVEYQEEEYTNVQYYNEDNGGDYSEGDDNYDDSSYDNEPRESYESVGYPEIVKPQISKKAGNIVLVTGLNGSGATQWIIDRAVEGAQRSKSVLIVDLDYTSAGILSFIDVGRFYAGGHHNFTPYQEDGVSMLSKGYGSKVTIQDFKKVERSFNNYDLVFIDCPVECLKIFDSHSLLNYRCFICSLVDISKIIEFSNKVSNREYTSIETEVALMQPDKVLYTNGTPTDEDLDYVKSMVFLPNGYWFD